VLLAQAHAFEGDFWKAEEIIAGLGRLQPYTTEDFVFLGLAQGVLDPDRGLMTLDKAFERARQPALARLTRAQVLCWRAGNDGDLADAERALDDIRKADLPDDHALVVLYRFNACMEAAKCYGARDPARRDALLEQAAQDVERLGRYPDFPMAVLFRCGYHMYRDDDQALLGEVRRARTRSDSATLASLETHVLYRRKKYEDALITLRSVLDRGGSFLNSEGYVLATLPGKRGGAVAMVGEAMRTIQGGPHVSFAPSVLLLLGPEYRARARDLFRQVRDEKAHLIPNARDRWYHHLLDYNCGGPPSAEELVARAVPSRVNRSEAYFFIALNKLAEGDRAGAKQFLTKCNEIFIDNSFECTWARAFLACIDDPNWLPWIPTGKK
jgi:tetratricopeptide (TPR) repeat protein